MRYSLSDCVFIGDSLVDAETARNAGIRFVASLTGKTALEEFRSYETMGYINELSELAWLVSFPSILL